MVINVGKNEAKFAIGMKGDKVSFVFLGLFDTLEKAKQYAKKKNWHLENGFEIQKKQDFSGIYMPYGYFIRICNVSRDFKATSFKRFSVR